MAAVAANQTGVRPARAGRRPSVPAWLGTVPFLAYVAGFLTLPAPGGLGVREALLQPFVARELEASLSSDRAEAEAVIVVLALRLVWTAAELVPPGQNAATIAVAWPPSVARQSG